MRKAWSALRRRFPLVLKSIRFRLALWFVAILGLVVLAFGTFVYLQQARDLRSETYSRLQDKIRQIQDIEQFGVRESTEGHITIPDLSGSAGPLLREGEVLAISNLQDQVMQKSGPISDSEINQLSNAQSAQASASGPIRYSLTASSTSGGAATEEYAFIIRPILLRDVPIGYLLLGTPVDPAGQLRRLLITLLVGGLGTLLSALLGGYWLADRAMRPVQTITQTAQQISESDLSRRLNLGTQDELGQLADTFDQMLARLQRAFERQRQFTADASHELRTPLTIVNLEAKHALASRRPTEEYQRALTVIQSENELMTRLVNDLLTLSRMDAGQTTMNMENLDLSDLALEAVERLAPIATRKGVELSTGELPELYVRGDRQYLSQMLTNLIENAIKYSSPPERKVRVETGQMDAKTAWVRVTDNGPGIPPEHLPHLFDRFYQVDKARARRDDEGEALTGSGLGLSIVQWIVQAHGGQVNVESRLGQGTSFEVRLPLA
jgi:two-component system OmpR family sensor kinase